MGIPMYTIPNELVEFTENQCNRFEVRPPYWELINVTADFVINYVARYRYFPTRPEEALHRYNHPGLTHEEKFKFIGPIEYKTRGRYENRYIELIAWAALVWAWTEEGLGHVDWVYRTEIAPELPERHEPTPLRNERALVELPIARMGI